MRNFINIDTSDYINAINLHLGIYYPLDGFVTHEEFKSILLKKRLKNYNYTIPINLFCSKSKYKKFELGETINLKFKKEIVGFLILKSKFKIRKNFFLLSIFKTNNKQHLGVNNFSKKIDKLPYSLGGNVFIYRNKAKFFFKNNNFDLVKKLKKIKFKDVVFSTRNIPHVGHNLIQKKIISSKKKITIFLILSIKNKYSRKILLEAYRSLKSNRIFKNINILFINLPTFFAGPNEAFFQAKIFENLKFKSFYVGRDHAGCKSFYNKFDSQNIFEKLKCKIQIIKLNEPMFCKSCNFSVINKFLNKKICPICGGKKLSELNGTDIKILIRQKKKVLLFKYLDRSVFNFFKKNNFSLQT